jgi:hypothetical protein
MLKLSDPFEMNDPFVGIFYNAETEALANEGEGSQKSNQRPKRLYRRARAMWRKLLRAFEGIRKAVPPIRQPEALTTESHHLDAVPNESAAAEFRPLTEKEASGFRPLTEEEKRQFLNSLDEDGKRILAELAGEKKIKAFASVCGTSREIKSGWYCAGHRSD